MARLKLSPDIFTRAWHGKGPVHLVYKEPRFGQNGMASSISPSFTFGLDGFSSDSAHINLLKLWLGWYHSQTYSHSNHQEGEKGRNIASY